MRKYILATFLAMLLVPAFSQTKESEIGSMEEVIYGRKDGMALTMNVLTPKAKSNNRGIILAISAGVRSNFDMALEWSASIAQPYLMKGYTVFEVCHGSAPKYNNMEVVSDVHRAVRFIRFNAAKYNINPDKLGITGFSSGGYISLMMGTTGYDADPAAKDPVDRMSGNVQAVACFFPPTDFLNFGRQGKVSMGTDLLSDYRAAFEFKTWNKETKHFEIITDKDKLLEIGREISPINLITSKTAPTLIAHGDMDELIPLQQSTSLIQKMKEMNVPCELMIKQGGTHKLWPDVTVYLIAFTEWFDKYLQ
jgi:dipeptidyl aminopeptidase/acylaminoacyl peptidase